MEEKVVLEVAEKEFERFAKEFDLDINVKNMSGEDVESFDGQKGKIVRAIMSGHAVVDETGNIIYTLKRPKEDGALKELTFRVPDGDVFSVMDKYKEGKNVHKLNSALAVITKQTPQTFVNMNAIDVKFTQAVASLFLAS